MEVVVQNKPTPLQRTEKPPQEFVEVCVDTAVEVFRQVMQWNPVRSAAEIAGAKLVSMLDNADFFEHAHALNETQVEWLKKNVENVFAEAADIAVKKVKDYETQKNDFVGNVVINEMTRIPELTMAAISSEINRGALLAMTAIKADATNEEIDKIEMRKTKYTGDITIPTRGVFISTNVIEWIKQHINFRDLPGLNTEVV